MESVESWRRWGRKKKQRKKKERKKDDEVWGLGNGILCVKEKKTKRWKKKRKGENVLIVYMDEKIEEWKNKIKN